MSRPCLLLAPAFALGIWLRHELGGALALSSSIPPGPVSGLVPATLLILIFALVLWRCGAARVALVVTAGAFGLLGALALHQARRPLPPDHIAHLADRPSLLVEGWLRRPPERFGERTRLTLEVERVFEQGFERRATGTVRGGMAGTVLGLGYGTRLRLLLRPRAIPDVPPGAFDAQAALARAGIHLTGLVTRDGLIRLSGQGGSSVQAAVERVRDRLRGLLDRGGGVGRGVVKALLIGERDGIPDPLQRDLFLIGVGHILSISGLHLTLVAWLSSQAALALLRLVPGLLLRLPARKVATLLALGPVVGYAAVAGAEVATLRSAVMALVCLGALLLDRAHDLLHTLAVAALALLIAWPEALFDISFQLSFASVAALLLLAPRMARLVPAPPSPLPRGLAWVWRQAGLSLTASIAATLGTVPLVALHFNLVSLIAPVANLVAVPLLGSLVVALALLSGVAALVWPGLGLLGFAAASGVADVTLPVLQAMGRFPWAGVRVVTPTALEVTILYALLLWLVMVSSRWMLTMSAVALVLLSGARFWPPRWQGTLEVTVLQAGGQDLVLLEAPGPVRILVLGMGGRMEGAAEERLIAPFLWGRGITRLDHLIRWTVGGQTTGADPATGRVQGGTLLTWFRPREVWDVGRPPRVRQSGLQLDGRGQEAGLLLQFRYQGTQVVLLPRRMDLDALDDVPLEAGTLLVRMTRRGPELLLFEDPHGHSPRRSPAPPAGGTWQESWDREGWHLARGQVRVQVLGRNPSSAAAPRPSGAWASRAAGLADSA